MSSSQFQGNMNSQHSNIFFEAREKHPKQTPPKAKPSPDQPYINVIGELIQILFQTTKKLKNLLEELAVATTELESQKELKAKISYKDLFSGQVKAKPGRENEYRALCEGEIHFKKMIANKNSEFTTEIASLQETILVFKQMEAKIVAKHSAEMSAEKDETNYESLRDRNGVLMQLVYNAMYSGNLQLLDLQKSQRAYKQVKEEVVTRIPTVLPEDEPRVEDEKPEPMSAAQQELMRQSAIRDEKILKLAQSSTELHGMFLQLDVMINTQGIKLENIGRNVLMAKENIKKGEKKLEKADDYSEKSSKMVNKTLLGLAAVIATLGVIEIAKVSIQKSLTK